MVRRCLGSALLVAAAIAGACGLNPQPSTPPSTPPSPPALARALGFHTCVAGATLSLDGAGVPALSAVTDANGYAVFPIVPSTIAAFNIHLTAADHAPYGFVVHDVRPGTVPIAYFFGDCESITWTRYAIFHPLDAWPALFKPLPRLTVRGQFFAADGQPFTAIEASDFNLYARYLAGDDISPVLAQRQAAGFNLLRVWLLYDVANIGRLIPAEHADFYARLPAFLRLCASYGLRVELTVFTGAERLLPGHAGRARASALGLRRCRCRVERHRRNGQRVRRGRQPLVAGLAAPAARTARLGRIGRC
jgi:hypothetical protein